MRSLRLSSARPKPRGFSFVEIVIVIAIMGLILAIGIPFFGTILHRSRVDGVAREIDMTVLAARLQAIKQGQSVGVVLSNDPSSSIGAYDTAITFVDADNNGALDTSTSPPDVVVHRDLLDSAGHRVSLRIDSPNQTSPSTTVGTAYTIFTSFGSVGSGGDKGIYVMDGHGNVLQVAVTTPATGKVALTKLVTGATPPYELPPWKWY
jgi:prepilin-type N-terminal cleavage/methylation domain-containing protein